MTTLYLKYRPQKIGDLDLTDVRETLLKIVASGNIPHAFLFEGPRGSGKTSAARIIAKVLNCLKPLKNNEPCNVCEQCVSTTKGTNIDVIELDAASHRGIDDVRLIRESVKLAPAKAGKKVYIIDEAHMLTAEASNALLKTLEEPPSHVVFILATTNPEKLLDTIKSRTVRIVFKKASEEEIIKSLVDVLEKENKKYDKKVLELIAKNCDGSFRDAKKILEELILKNFINDIAKTEEYFYNRGSFDIDDFFHALSEKNINKTASILKNAENRGVPAKSVYVQTIGKLKDVLLIHIQSKQPDSGLPKKDNLLLLEIFIAYWNGYQNDVSEYLPLYMACSRWCFGQDNENGKNGINKKADSTHPSGRVNPDKSKEMNPVLNINFKSSSVGKDHSVTLNEHTNDHIELSDDLWKRTLSLIRNKNASTEALLRASKPMGFEGGRLSLGVFYKFHKEKLESLPHRICLEDSLREVIGEEIKVECFLTEPQFEKKLDTAKDESQNIHPALTKDSEVILSDTDDLDLMKLADEVFGS